MIRLDPKLKLVVLAMGILLAACGIAFWIFFLRAVYQTMILIQQWLSRTS